MPSSNSMKSVTNTHSTVSNFVVSSETVKAEIRWVLKSVISGYSNNSSANLNNLFSCMFPDSQLAKSFKLGADKMRYSINFGLAPFFKSLWRYKKVMLLCGLFWWKLESCHTDLWNGYCDTFFNKSKNLAESRYWNSKFLGHGTAVDLETEFGKCMEELDQPKMCQISMDGTSVNWIFFDSSTKRKRRRFACFDKYW